MSDKKEMSQGLLRQRRNYIVVSCILIFLVFSQVKIEALSLLGLKFSDFEKPEAIYVALWIAYFYFTIRYMQYFGEEGFYRVYNAYTGTFSNKINKYAYQQALKIGPHVTYTPQSHKAIADNKWVIDVSDDEEPTEKVQLSFFKIYRLYIYSALDVTFKQSVVWDYVVPFVIGLFAFIYCFYDSEATLINAIKVIFA